MSLSINLYTNVKEAIKGNKAFVYKKKNQLPYETIPFNKLFGAIEDIGDTALSKSGIPSELINRMDMSLETPRVTYTDDKNKVAYYSPFEVDTVEHVLTIIKLFNQLSSINLSVYTSHKIQQYAEGFANSNISFFSYDNPKELIIAANKIITYGYSARSFIQQKIPTLIIGPNGLGGWVTPDNIEYLLKDNFKGRPSGRCNELIPLEILVDEFTEIHEEENLKAILENNASMVHEYITPFFAEHKKEHFIESQNRLFEHLENKEKRWELKPKLASNVRVVKEKEATMIQRQEINDVLFSLPESDLEFLEDLKRDLSCKTLQDKYEMNDEDFWDIMVPLWERKAIIFSL
jgi:hypothetical protein